MVSHLEEVAQEPRWLSLGVACKLLNISQATLRQWGDNGLVRTFRTPGGHRRFLSDDISALTENGEQSADADTPTLASNAVVLPRIRRKLSGVRVHAPDWRAQFDDASQERMRVLGREVLDLCRKSLGHPRQPQMTSTALSLGTTYGVEMATRGVSLTDAIQAFTFFRSAMLEALTLALLRHSNSDQELNRSWQELVRITDQVLLGMTKAIQETPGPAASVSA